MNSLSLSFTGDSFLYMPLAESNGRKVKYPADDQGSTRFNANHPCVAGDKIALLRNSQALARQARKLHKDSDRDALLISRKALFRYRNWLVTIQKISLRKLANSYSDNALKLFHRGRKR